MKKKHDHDSFIIKITLSYSQSDSQVDFFEIPACTINLGCFSVPHFIFCFNHETVNTIIILVNHKQVLNKILENHW